MVNFLLLIKNLVNYTKKDIDEGKTPSEIYKICSCIRETFCLSYAIRKENDLYIYFQQGFVLVKFEGVKLKFLSSDERSQALLLNKALIKIKKSKNKDVGWIKSTPGIYIRKFFSNISFIHYLKSLKFFKPIYIIYNQKELGDSYFSIEEFDMSANLSDYFYIIPTYNIVNGDFAFFQSFKELRDIKFFMFSKIDKLEDKILFINFQIDLLRKSN